MKVIKIKLEYRCFPVWIYDENNVFVKNDLPNYLIGDIDVDPLFVNIQETYDSLYLNDGVEFKYIGFSDKGKQKSFCNKLYFAIELLKSKLNGEYIIEETDLVNDLIAE